MSITSAADALCLTQSAVSRQVRSLEEALSLQLLVRGHRSIRFTPEGEKLYLAVRDPMASIIEATRSFGEIRPRSSVSITTSIGIAGLWLLPRLGKLQSAFPELDIKVMANNKVEDLHRSGTDLAIRYCSNADAPPGAVRLFDEEVGPVCACAYPSGRRLDPELIASSTLLEFDGEFRPWLHWQTWLEHFGWSSVRPARVLRYNQYDQIIHAAMAGQGIALGRLNLIRPSLAASQLRELAVPSSPPANDHAYWLFCAEDMPQPDVVRVATWLQTEASDTSAAL